MLLFIMGDEKVINGLFSIIEMLSALLLDADYYLFKFVFVVDSFYFCGLAWFFGFVGEVKRELKSTAFVILVVPVWWRWVAAELC